MAELVKHRDELVSRQAKSDGHTEQFVKAMNERFNYYRKPSTSTLSPFDKDVRQLESEVAGFERCVKDAYIELDTYTKPKKP